MFFTKLQEYNMHKSVIILSILLFGFDVNAGKKNQESFSRFGAIYNIDLDLSGQPRRKRSSISESVAELALLKKCKIQSKELKEQEKEIETLRGQLQDLRSKLAVSPEDSGFKGESSSSHPDHLMLDAESSSVSPMTVGTSPNSGLSAATSPITISKSEKMEIRYPYVDSPCGSGRKNDYFAPSSFPGNEKFSLGSLKPIPPYAPYTSNFP